jgi:hypothetical protein
MENLDTTLTLADRLKLRDTLRIKLGTYAEILEHLGRERMILWEQEIINDREIRKMQEGRTAHQ